MKYVYDVPKIRYKKFLKRIARIDYWNDGSLVNSLHWNLPVDEKRIEIYDKEYIPHFGEEIPQSGKILKVIITDYKTKKRRMEIELEQSAGKDHNSHE